MRYRKKRFGGRRRSTNVIKMKFQSFMDISTSDSSMQIISISAGGREILKRLMPQFGAYKYYKIGGISVNLVPASTLPVDPSGLSYSISDPGVDPRDQLTPGMMRITNGEDVLENISGLDDNQQHGLYNTMMLDPRWYKWMLQSGVKRYAKPRYWQIGQLHQDKWPGAITNYPEVNVDNSSLTGTVHSVGYHAYGTTTGPVFKDEVNSSPYGFFQTGHRGVLGWLPTDGLQPIGADNGLTPLIASPPEVQCITVVLPKAYKTRYYYRMFITETVYFKEPIVNFGVGYTTSLGANVSYRPLDVFHYVVPPTPDVPSSPTNPDAAMPDSYTGGNYGDD